MRGKFTFLYAVLGLTATAGIGQVAFKALEAGDRHRLLSPAMNAPAAPPADWEGPIIYGSINYTNEEDPSKYGIYAVDAPTGRIAPIYLENHLDANGSGIYQDGVYKFVSCPDGASDVLYYEYNVADWTLLKKEVLPDMTNIALDEAYDPVTGNTYGCFSDEKNTKFLFGYVDHETHNRVAVSDTDVLYFGIVATPKGKVYGIGHDGIFYDIDKTTGKRTAVGKLGINPKYNQTAICDLQTGKIYWLGVNTDGASGIYEINESTGKAKLIRSFSKREGFVGAFIIQEPWPENVPAAPADLVIDCEDAATSGTITFTIPSTLINGKTLEGKQKYKVLLDSKEFYSGEANPGESISIPFSVSNEGRTAIVAYVEGKDRPGKIARIDPYIGYDAPVAVANLKAVLNDDNSVTLTWDAPTAGANDGYLDGSNLSYRIVRQPGNVTVSTGYKKTSFSQKLSATAYHAYKYEIVPISHGRSGATASTEYLALGPAFKAPYSQNMTSEADLVNVVTFGKAWGYDTEAESMLFTGSTETGVNALMTPYIDLDSSKAYKVEVECTSLLGKTTLKAAAAKKLNIEDITVNAFDAIVPVGEEPAKYETYIYVPESDNWHISLQGSTEDPAAFTGVRNIKVTEYTSSSAPAMVTGVSVKPGDKGKEEASISFNLPEKAIDGSPLSSISKVVIYRGNDLIKSFDNPKEKKISFTDEKATLGETTYTLRADNANGTGIPVKVNVYIGQDVPNAPTGLYITESDNLLTLHWTAPTTGIRGAYIDPESLTYAILRSDNVMVAEKTTGTSFKDENQIKGSQRFIQYALQASSPAGPGVVAVSEAFVAGTPYPTPFEEYFTAGGLDYPFWEARIGATASKTFIINRGTGCDGEIGYVSYKPGSDDDEASIVSGKITPSELDNPTLGYYYYVHSGEPTVLEVNAETNDKRIINLDRISFADDKCGDGWRYRAVSAAPVMNVQNFRLAFRVINNGASSGTGIDNISVAPGFGKNLSIVHSPVGIIRYGDSKTVNVMVTNNGSQTINADAYNVRFLKNGKVAATLPGVKLERNASATLEFTLTVDPFDSENISINADAILAGDENPADNTSAPTVTAVGQSSYPAPRDFKGSMTDEGSVTLSWQNPDESGLKDVVVLDDIELYQPFAINNVGEWEMKDMDGANTFGIANSTGGYHAFPNALDPKAFIVFNVPESGVSPVNEFGQPTKWAAHSGDQCLISFQASGMFSDDWLISPTLSGKKQKISFYAKNVSSSSNEPAIFEVLYSYGSLDTEDFLPVEVEIATTDEWKLYEFDIPAGARRFAIRCNSTGYFAFMIDDITYSPEDLTNAKLEGFNVYRDRKMINKAPISGNEYKETISEPGTTYAVTAIYNTGESLPTEEIHLCVSGTDVTISSDIRLITDNGELTIEGAEGKKCIICTLDGAIIFSSDSMAEKNVVRTGKGIFLLRIDNRSYKLNIQ